MFSFTASSPKAYVIPRRGRITGEALISLLLGRTINWLSVVIVFATTISDNAVGTSHNEYCCNSYFLKMHVSMLILMKIYRTSYTKSSLLYLRFVSAYFLAYTMKELIVGVKMK